MLVAGIGIVAFRDQGIRPLSGKYKTSYMIASESSALSSLGYQVLGDIAPGQAIIIDENGVIDRKTY